MKQNAFPNSTEYIGLKPPSMELRATADYTWEEVSYVPDFNFKSFSDIYALDFIYVPSSDEKSAHVTAFNLCHLSMHCFHGTSLRNFFTGLETQFCGNICIGVYDLSFYGFYLLNYMLSAGWRTKTTPYKLGVGDAFYMISPRSQHLYYTYKAHSDLQITFVDLYSTFRLKKEELIELFPADTFAETCMLALNNNFKNGLYFTTLSTNSFAEFKHSITTKLYEQMYSGEYSTTYARQAFLGGYCYAAPKYRCKELHNVYGYDINSMYPDAMLHAPLPFGDGLYYKGDVSKFAGRDRLYIQHCRVCFMLRDGGVPTLYGSQTDLVGHPTDSKGQTRELYLTNWDMQLLKDNYILISIEYIDGMVYAYTKGARDINEDEDGKGSAFFAFVTKYRHIKETAEGAERVIAKHMLNTLFGALSRRTDERRMRPTLELSDRGSGVIVFDIYTPPADEPRMQPRYVELSCFIAAYARYRLVQDIKKHIDTFIYCDTDSMYLTEPAADLQLDPRRFGYYKQDKKILRMYVVGAKRYIWEGYIDGDKVPKTCIACSGATQNIISQMTFDNFKEGGIFYDNEITMQVKGGAIKKGCPFKLTTDNL